MIMKNIQKQKCFNHSAREAAARCPACNRYYCRECVTEHEDRVLCALCLKKSSIDQDKQTKRGTWIVQPCIFCFGVILIWLFFFYLGDLLLSLPADFHVGTIWKNLR